MLTVKILMALLGLLVSLPIAFVLQYQILAHIDATPLMWVLFWVNLPVVILVTALAKIVEVFDEK